MIDPNKDQFETLKENMFSITAEQKAALIAAIKVARVNQLVAFKLGDLVKTTYMKVKETSGDVFTGIHWGEPKPNKNYKSYQEDELLPERRWLEVAKNL